MTDVSRLHHRMRCITVEPGIVEICPKCGHKTVTGWTWDFRLDPDGPDDDVADIHIDGQAEADVFIEACRDIGTTLLFECSRCLGLDDLS